MPVTLKDSYSTATMLTVKTVRNVNFHPTIQLSTKSMPPSSSSVLISIRLIKSSIAAITARRGDHTIASFAIAQTMIDKPAVLILPPLPLSSWRWRIRDSRIARHVHCNRCHDPHRSFAVPIQLCQRGWGLLVSLLLRTLTRSCLAFQW
jgi:hypothetical protein